MDAAEKSRRGSELVFPLISLLLSSLSQLHQSLGIGATCSPGPQMPHLTPCRLYRNFSLEPGAGKPSAKGERTGSGQGLWRDWGTAVALWPISQMRNPCLPGSVECQAWGRWLALLES